MRENESEGVVCRRRRKGKGKWKQSLFYFFHFSMKGRRSEGETTSITSRTWRWLVKGECR